MKGLTIVISFVVLWLTCGCSKETSVSQTNNQKVQEAISDCGHGTVMGWEGYFSPELSPVGYPQPLPPGYAMSRFTWEQGAPDSSYNMLYLEGQESDLAKARRLRATGNWKAVTRTIGAYVAHYVILSIDSLEILE